MPSPRPVWAVAVAVAAAVAFAVSVAVAVVAAVSLAPAAGAAAVAPRRHHRAEAPSFWALAATSGGAHALLPLGRLLYPTSAGMNPLPADVTDVLYGVHALALNSSSMSSSGTCVAGQYFAAGATRGPPNNGSGVLLLCLDDSGSNAFAWAPLSPAQTLLAVETARVPGSMEPLWSAALVLENGSFAVYNMSDMPGGWGGSAPLVVLSDAVEVLPGLAAANGDSVFFATVDATGALRATRCSTLLSVGCPHEIALGINMSDTRAPVLVALEADADFLYAMLAGAGVFNATKIRLSDHQVVAWNASVAQREAVAYASSYDFPGGFGVLFFQSNSSTEKAGQIEFDTSGAGLTIVDDALRTDFTVAYGIEPAVQLFATTAPTSSAAPLPTAPSATSASSAPSATRESSPSLASVAGSTYAAAPPTNEASSTIAPAVRLVVVLVIVAAALIAAIAVCAVVGAVVALRRRHAGDGESAHRVEMQSCHNLDSPDDLSPTIYKAFPASEAVTADSPSSEYAPMPSTPATCNPLGTYDAPPW